MRLRPPTPDDAELLESWEQSDYIGEFNRFGPPSRPVPKALRQKAPADDGPGTFIVEADGRPIGTVSWHAEMYGPNPESRAWNIGINLIPDGRGKGFGGEAQRMLAMHLLATTPANRIEAMTDLDNLAEQRSLEKAGFAREGVLRGAQFRAGKWHDIVVYSLVRPRRLPPASPQPTMERT